MSFFSKFRLPYREDLAFSLLALAVFVVPLAFSAFSYENFESVKFSLLLICLGPALAILLQKQKTGNLNWRYQPLTYGLLAVFAFWAVLTTIFSIDHLYSLLGFYYRYTSGLLFYFILLIFILLLVNLLDSERMSYLLKILVVDALVVAIISFLQSFGWIFYAGVDIPGLFRGPSLLGNIDYSAMFLAAVLPIVVYFFIEAKTTAAKIYYALVIFFIILANYILASRGAFLAMAAAVFLAIVVMLLYNFPKKILWGIILTSLVSIIFGYFVLSISRPAAISSIANSIDENTSFRLYAWNVSLTGIFKHPLLGTGPGTYALFFEQHRPSTEISSRIGIFDDAHNLFLHMAVTGGLPLALLFLAIIALAFYYGLKDLKGPNRLLNLCLLSSVAAWLVSASFNPVPIPMFLLLGVLVAGLLFPNLPKREIHLAVWMKTVLIALGWIIFLLGCASLISEHLLGFAGRAYRDGNYAKAYQFSSLGYSLNASNGLLLIYKIGSEVKLGQNKSLVVRDIEKIVRLHAKQANSYNQASNLYALLYNTTNNPEDLKQAVFYLKLSLKFDPLFSARYGQLALYNYQLNDLSGARQAVLQDLGLDQNDFSGWILLAKLYQLQNNKPATINALTRAFSLNPNIPELTYILRLAKTLPDIRQVPIQIAARYPLLN